MEEKVRLYNAKGKTINKINGYEVKCSACRKAVYCKDKTKEQRLECTTDFILVSCRLCMHSYKPNANCEYRCRLEQSSNYRDIPYYCGYLRNKDKRSMNILEFTVGDCSLCVEYKDGSCYYYNKMTPDGYICNFFKK